jgi:hypothetical protein
VTDTRGDQEVADMQARMDNPATVIPDAMRAILNLWKASREGGVAESTLELGRAT